MATLKDPYNSVSDEKLKTQVKLLERVFYYKANAICQRFLVGEDIQKGNLPLSSSFSTVTTVLSIFRLVAVDLPTAHLTRFLTTFQKVMNCRCEPSKSMMTSATSIRSKASRHLLYAHMSSSSYVGQFLAISLLSNAQFDEGLFAMLDPTLSTVINIVTFNPEYCSLSLQSRMEMLQPFFLSHGKLMIFVKTWR